MKIKCFCNSAQDTQILDLLMKQVLLMFESQKL